MNRSTKPDGLREWFKGFYRKYNRALYWHIIGKGFQPVDAQDLCQEVWSDVSKHPERIRQAEKPEALLCKIAHDKIVDFFRSNSHHPENAPQSDPPEMEDLPDRWDRRESRQEWELEMEEALNYLSDKNHEILELFMDEGLSELEIAHRLGIPVGTVYSRFHNLIHTIRDYFKEK